ncbi:MAG: sigma-70 family RNA polymerase sigma factor [Clostridia bacterium]|nr:sigma-70 family RNA polymerase sigma factor [Clostridia bacterium]
MKKDEFNNCLKIVHNGDIGGLKEIYDEYYEKCKSEAKYILRDDSEAYDAAMKTMMNIIRYAQSNPDPHVEHAGAYMRRASKNAAYEMLRSEKKEADVNIADVACTADKDRFEDKVCLKIAIEKLPALDFRIATGFYFYGLSIEEIANDVGKAKSTVNEHLSKIKKRLARELSEN